MQVGVEIEHVLLDVIAATQLLTVHGIFVLVEQEILPVNVELGGSSVCLMTGA